MDSALPPKNYNAPRTQNLPRGEVLLPETTIAPLKDETWAFLRSTRFWVMIAGCLSVYLSSKGWIGEEERNLIASIAAIFVTIKTLDKTVDKLS
jgi:hypothetical protein